MPDERKVNPQNTTQQSPDLEALKQDADSKMASLAFATTIANQFMPQEEETLEEDTETSPEGSQEPTEEVTEEEETEEVEAEEDTRIEDLEENLNKRFDDLESKIEEGDKKGLKELTKTVKDALKD